VGLPSTAKAEYSAHKQQGLIDDVDQPYHFKM